MRINVHLGKNARDCVGNSIYLLCNELDAAITQAHGVNVEVSASNNPAPNDVRLLVFHGELSDKTKLAEQVILTAKTVVSNALKARGYEVAIENIAVR